MHGGAVAGQAGELTLGDLVADNALRFPDVVAYRHDDRALTHAELHCRARQLASALASVGVRRQDRVAILSRNSIEFGEVLAATALSGMILATVNFRSSEAEVRDVLDRVRPAAVIVSAEFADMVAGIAPQLRATPPIVRIGGGSATGATGYEEFLKSGSADGPEFHAHADDIACLLFTSGTTGPSKACVLGQRELRAVYFAMNTEMRSGSRDTALINMPMFHFGAIAIIGGIHARGGSVVLQTQFDVAEAIELISTRRVDVLHLAPVMLRALVEGLVEGPSSGAEHGADSVRNVVYSAAPMTSDVLVRAMSVMPRAGFLNLYGQTEAIVSVLPRELHDPDGGDDRLRSVGYPFPGVRVRILDEDGREAPRGTPGEIVVRTSSAFRGYWDDHGATITTLRDGWCHTGDIGRFDERGLLYLVDRKKDVIITGGENVYSPEVEDVISAMAGVAACAVVGVPDDRWGEAVCAVVVPEAGNTVLLSDVQAAVRARLAAYKVPRTVEIVAELPVLASGKTDKKRLRAALAQRQPGCP